MSAEVENAKRLSRLLTVRQRDWNSWKEKHEIPPRIRRYPDNIFAPEVIHVIPEVNAMILEFLGGFIPLLQAEMDQKAQWGYAGYALARLHGPECLQTDIQLYTPFFKLLKTYIDEEYLNYWIQVLEQSRGGVEFIHGDSHLSNILVAPTRIAWIDAIMLPNLDRMDDIGYIISHAVQERVSMNIGFGIDD
ncbi:MAG: hypothetical protein ACFE95_14500, partial [Candidatus Hodarchaeota archaeon]